MKKQKLDALYSGIEFIENSTVLYTNKGEYSVMFKIKNVTEKFCADIEAYYNFNEFILSIAKTLGEGYAIQKQDIFSKQNFKNEDSEIENGEFLSKAYFNFFNGREFTEIDTYLIITQEKKKSTLLQFDSKKWKEFHLKVDKVKEIFKSKRIEYKQLSEQEVRIYIYRYFCINFQKGTFSLDNFSSNDYSLKIGKKDVVCMSVVDVDTINLPSLIRPFRTDSINGNDMPVDIMSFLSNVPNADCVIYNQVIIIPPQRSENAKLTKKRNRHSSLPDPSNDLAANEIDKVQADIAKNNKMLLYTHYNVILCAESGIQQACSFVENELSKSGITPSKSAYNQLELFLTSFPGHSFNINPDYDRFLTLEDTAACLFYKEFVKGDEDSKLKVYYTDRQGIPIGIDITGKEGKVKYTTNSNFFSLGPSGSGKSFHMNSVVRQLYEQNTDIVMVDTGHSYEGLCSYVGGKYITYSEEKPISMNPFRISKEEYNVEKTNFLKSLIFLIWKGADGMVSKTEDAIIDKVLSKFYDFYFEPFNGFSEAEKENLKTTYILEHKSRREHTIEDEYRFEERKKLVERIDKLETLYERGDGGEKDNARIAIDRILEDQGYQSVDDLKNPDTMLLQVIEKRIKSQEERLRAIKVNELSYNSFYEFAIQMIPIISQEERVPFEIDDFAFILKRFYKDGKWSRTLNEDFDSSLFDEKFIVFEIDAIKDDPELFPIITLIIMDVFIQKMRLKPNRKALIIEEAWKAIASPLMADYIKYLYKTVRKFWGIVGVVTQELDDIIGNQIVKDAIVNNSEITILLDQSKFKERYSEIAKMLGLSEVEQRKIWTINSIDNKDGRSFFKEVYIRRGNKGDVFGVEEPPECYMAYTTERVEKDGLKKYINKFGDTQVAITEFCKDWKASGYKFASDFAPTIKI